MMNRRAFLTRSAAIGCSLAASPLVTPVTFAATPGDNRLVVILLRGGMDGLGAVAPYGDAEFAAHRGDLLLGGRNYFDLDGFYAMHPGFAALRPLWNSGELSFAHAVSTPYRDKRSHFDGQDLLEAGISDLKSGTSRDGWMNRMLQLLPETTAETAYAVGSEPLSILGGQADVSRWSPDADLALSPQAIRLARLIMRDDPAMAEALRTAFDLADSDGDAIAVEGGAGQIMAMMQNDMKSSREPGATHRVAAFVGQQLKASARVAAFSLGGFDTHDRQEMELTRALSELSDAIVTIRDESGPDAWAKTAVIAMTEFGRTVRLNGTKGTDHGTGGAMLLAGGAVQGGKVFGDWPGLQETALYERRDLMPTRDIRAYAGWAIHGLFGVNRTAIETTVFPGLNMGKDPKILNS